MEFIKCSNGHTYDPSITPECPECARLRGKTVPLDGAMDGGFGSGNYGKTEPVVRDTMAANVGGAVHWADAKSYMEASSTSENYAPTMPVGYQNEDTQKSELPVTGWLVCVEGASKGQDFRICEEYNYIGRSSKMDICIQGDPTISRENHAIIAYDTLERIFYFAPSGGGSIVRVNGKAVLGNVELKAYDRLTIGQSQFLFVPFCGENFEWKK